LRLVAVEIEDLVPAQRVAEMARRDVPQRVMALDLIPGRRRRRGCGWRHRRRGDGAEIEDGGALHNRYRGKVTDRLVSEGLQQQDPGDETGGERAGPTDGQASMSVVAAGDGERFGG